MNENVTILNSNSNVYASQVGFLYSPMRFRYRALNQKYNDVYINGAPMNDMESGQFRYSMVGGINQQTRNVDYALPFENNNFSMTALAGSNNYDFRAGSMAGGHRITLSAANRNYTLRGMYNYASGFNAKGWAIAASVAYRWANRGYVEGTFYNSLSYYFGVQKKWNNGHSLALATMMYGIRMIHATVQHRLSLIGRRLSTGGATRRTDKFNGIAFTMLTNRLQPTARTLFTTCRLSTLMQ